MQKAIDDGHDRIVVILTRPKDTVREQKRDIGPATILKRTYPQAAEKLLNRYRTYNDEVALAKEYERDGRVLILAPESLYGLNTLSKSFEGLERMYRAGYAAAEAIPSFLKAEDGVRTRIGCGHAVFIACELFVSKLRRNTKIL